MPFLHANAMPHIRLNGWTYTILARENYVTHTSKWTDQSDPHYLHATNTTKLVINNILARDRHAIHTPKWTDP
jgi:hypothetical protein